eukprot:tig00000219_g19484.t1
MGLGADGYRAIAEMTVLEIHGAANRFVLSSVGARVATWTCFDRATSTWRTVCKGDASKAPTQDGYRFAVMFPWVNRIGGASWKLEDPHKGPVEVPVEPFPANLHGLLADAVFQIVDSSPSSATFRTRMAAHRLYPLPLECTVKYSIVQASIPGAASAASRESLCVEVHARNLADRAAYLTTGVHPYFVNPFGGRVDDMSLRIAAANEVAVDGNLIPTGGFVAVPPERSFPVARPLAGAKFDNGYPLVKGSSPAASLTFRNFELHVLPGHNCDTVQVYTPGDREEIAIEPQAGGADAFRDPKHGRVLLAPGQPFTFSCTLSAAFL